MNLTKQEQIFAKIKKSLLSCTNYLQLSNVKFMMELAKDRLTEKQNENLEESYTIKKRTLEL